MINVGEVESLRPDSEYYISYMRPIVASAWPGRRVVVAQQLAENNDIRQECVLLRAWQFRAEAQSLAGFWWPKRSGGAAYMPHL